MSTTNNWLPFISNTALCQILEDLKHAADKSKAKADRSLSRNVIDPFTALFQMQLLEIPLQDWPNIEKRRQIEKSLQNHIGGFHQKLLGSLNGWCDMGVGSVVDLISEQGQIIAEVKNKHNTLKASDQASLYDKLHDLVRKKGQKYYGFTAYYVEIIPKHPTRYNIPFVPSDNTTGAKKPEDPLIRRVDGASFYAIATGCDDALIQIYKALPNALSEIGLQPINSTDKANLLNYFADAFGRI